MIQKKTPDEHTVRDDSKSTSQASHTVVISPSQESNTSQVLNALESAKIEPDPDDTIITIDMSQIKSKFLNISVNVCC